MPPPAAAEVAVAQLVPLLLLLALPLLELEELQAAVSTRPLTTAAPAAISCLERTIFPPKHSPRDPGSKSHILARQVEIMTSQGKQEVAGRWRPRIRSRAGW
jgi:hypothetical protein